MADLDAKDISNLKINDLKKELKARGLSVAGTKSELLGRLMEAIEKGTGEPGSVDDTLSQEDEELLNDPAEDGQIKESGRTNLPSEGLAVSAQPEVTESKSKAEVSSSASDHTKKAIADVKKLTAEERLKLRQQKFNIVAAEDKKDARAKRFGLPQTVSATATAPASKPAGTEAATVAANLEKLKQRSERFGQAVSETIKQVEATERILKRKQRFGAVAPVAVTADVEEKKKKRAERFGAAKVA